MPKPRPKEKQSDYISRAIPVLMEEGLTRKAAVGKAYGLWESEHPKKTGKQFRMKRKTTRTID